MVDSDGGRAEQSAGPLSPFLSGGVNAGAWDIAWYLDRPDEVYQAILSDLLVFEGPLAVGDSETTEGLFEYREARGALRSDTFTITDDDGMSLVLDHLKRFHGYNVRLTVEVLPRSPYGEELRRLREEDATAGDDPSPVET